jgi:cell wall-associated NlpC family hydrolase
MVGPGRFGPTYYDCSGLMVAAYKAVGIHISDITYTQVADGRAIPVDPQYVQPGDLLFFRGDVPVADFGHVAMAISATEEVEAPHTGDVVKRVPIPWDKVQAIRRIV